jgi:hypothetical protein
MARTPCRVTMIVKTGMSACAPACANAGRICDARTNTKAVRIVRPTQARCIRQKKRLAFMIGAPHDKPNLQPVSTPMSGRMVKRTNLSPSLSDHVLAPEAYSLDVLFLGISQDVLLFNALVSITLHLHGTVVLPLNPYGFLLPFGAVGAYHSSIPRSGNVQSAAGTVALRNAVTHASIDQK